jgi:hypothetical protein
MEKYTYSTFFKIYFGKIHHLFQPWEILSSSVWTPEIKKYSKSAAFFTRENTILSTVSPRKNIVTPPCSCALEHYPASRLFQPGEILLHSSVATLETIILHCLPPLLSANIVMPSLWYTVSPRKNIVTPPCSRVLEPYPTNMKLRCLVQPGEILHYYCILP